MRAVLVNVNLMAQGLVAGPRRGELGSDRGKDC